MSESILQDKQLMKALCVWVELKPLFYDGRFKNVRSNRKILAKYLNMGTTSFIYKLNRLIKRGLAHWEGTDLVLCSWNTLFECLGQRKTDNHRYKFYRLANTIPNSEFLFRFYAIKENFDKQKAVIEKKIYQKYFKEERELSLLKMIQSTQSRNDIAILDRQRIVSGLIDQIDKVQQTNFNRDRAFKKFKKYEDLGTLFANGCRTYFNELHTFNFNSGINFDISISCKRMAQIYGLSSGSSGHYWQQRLKGHFWSIHPRSVYIKDMNTFRFNHELREGNLKHHYFEGRKRGIFRRLTNRIDLKEPIAFQ